MGKSVLSEKRFHDEQAAFDYVEGKLWPDGPVCPKCGGEGYALKGVKGKPLYVKKNGKVVLNAKGEPVIKREALVRMASRSAAPAVRSSPSA